MRFQLTFVLLLIIAATSTSVVWRDLAAARAGDIWASTLVLTLAPVGVAALILSGRIVIKSRVPARAAVGGKGACA